MNMGGDDGLLNSARCSLPEFLTTGVLCLCKDDASSICCVRLPSDRPGCVPLPHFE
jgi:hypothetical protein